MLRPEEAPGHDAEMTREEQLVYDILEFMKSGEAKDSRIILHEMLRKGWTQKEVEDAFVTCITKGYIDLGGMGLPDRYLN